MKKGNIFLGNGHRTIFVNVLYGMLMRREVVTYKNVYEGAGLEVNQVKSMKGQKFYKGLRNAFKDVIKMFREKCGDKCLNVIDKGRSGATYQYVGEDKDPLCEEREAVRLKMCKDYAEFCKMSYHLFPAKWFLSFFDNTPLLAEIQRKENAGKMHIASTSDEPVLKNIDLLPVISGHIIKEHVVKFVYKPFDKPAVTLMFHPQFLKETNGRWLLYGKAEQRKRYPYVVALDRIDGEVSVVTDIDYEPAADGYYIDYFRNIVGGKKERHKAKEQVVIRTKTNYIHGLLTTKRFHHSQKETMAFGKHEDGDYGEIALCVIPNRELVGHILNFGQDVEVLAPKSLRGDISKIVKDMATMYSLDGKRQHEDLSKR